MQPDSLLCLGTGDGMACHDRNHSAFLYRFPDTGVLVDAGEPVSRGLRAAGIQPDAIERLLLTHLHGDHVGGLLMLLQGWWLDRRRRPLAIHLPVDGIAPLRALLEASMLFPELLGFPVTWHPLAAGDLVLEGAPAGRITAFPTTHLARLQADFGAAHPLRYEAFSFRFDVAGHRIAHSGDIGDIADLEPLLSLPVDLLVMELAHVDAAELFRFLNGRDIGRIVFTHLGRRHWEACAETVALAERLLPRVPFALAADGLVVPL